MKPKLLTLFFIFSCIILLQSCKFWYIAPRPNRFELYRNKMLGVDNSSKLKTNGFYYYIHKSKNIPEKSYLSYYRFSSNGRIYFSGNIPANYGYFDINKAYDDQSDQFNYLAKQVPNPDSLYIYLKRSIAQNIDGDVDQDGYYHSTNNLVKMECVDKEREVPTGRNRFYKTTGLLSKNADTLYIKEKTYKTKYAWLDKVEILDKRCIFYEFPK